MNPFIHLFYKSLNSKVESEILLLQKRLINSLLPLSITPNFKIDTHSNYNENYIKSSMNPGFHLCLLGTGGTEAPFLNYLTSLEKHASEKENRYPLILLAHGDMNSLASSLECMAKLRKMKKKSFLFHIKEQEKLEVLFRVLNARIKFNDVKLGVFGQPSEWLISSNLDTLSGKKEFMGVDLAESLKKINWEDLVEVSSKIEDNDPELLKLSAELEKNEEKTWKFKSEIKGKDIIQNTKLFIGMKRLKEKHQLSGLTLRCFDLIKFNVTGCLAISMLNDMGIPSACEGDIPSMFTMNLAYHLTNGPSFMANPIDFSDRFLTMAHCTIPRNLTSKYVLRTHFESDKGIGIQADLKDENKPWTLSRINLFENDISSNNVKISNIPFDLKSESRCRTQINVEFKSGDDLQNFLKTSSGNHHILTPGAHESAFKLFKELFI